MLQSIGIEALGCIAQMASVHYIYGCVKEGPVRPWRNRADIGWIQPTINFKCLAKRQSSQTNFASNGCLERFYPCTLVSIDQTK